MYWIKCNICFVKVIIWCIVTFAKYYKKTIALYSFGYCNNKTFWDYLNVTRMSAMIPWQKPEMLPYESQKAWNLYRPSLTDSNICHCRHFEIIFLCLQDVDALNRQRGVYVLEIGRLIEQATIWTVNKNFFVQTISFILPHLQICSILKTKASWTYFSWWWILLLFSCKLNRRRYQRYITG